VFLSEIFPVDAVVKLLKQWWVCPSR